MTDGASAEIGALFDLFRQALAREVKEPVFDQAARACMGQMIGSAMRKRGSYGSRR